MTFVKNIVDGTEWQSFELYNNRYPGFKCIGINSNFRRYKDATDNTVIEVLSKGEIKEINGEQCLQQETVLALKNTEIEIYDSLVWHSPFDGHPSLSLLDTLFKYLGYLLLFLLTSFFIAIFYPMKLYVLLPLTAVLVVVELYIFKLCAFLMNNFSVYYSISCDTVNQPGKDKAYYKDLLRELCKANDREIAKNAKTFLFFYR